MLIVIAASWSASAAAQGIPSPDAGGADEVTSLEQQLARDYDALSTADCAVACQALGSMHRAADRLCGLDPGPRCSGARTKVADAENHVRQACPDCPIGAETSVDEKHSAEPAAAPPPEAPSSENCAKCAIADEEGVYPGAFAASLALAAWLTRRHRRRDRGRV